MRTRLVKWLCIAVLFFAFVLWGSMADYELAVRVVVCAGAAVVAVQAFRAAKRRWTVGFLVIAFLFNPVIPPFRLAGGLGPCCDRARRRIVRGIISRAEVTTAALHTIDHGSQSGQ